MKLCMILIALAVLILPGCNTYRLTVYKTVVALPGATVEMNSATEASGNTSSPTTDTTPTLEAEIPLVP